MIIILLSRAQCSFSLPLKKLTKSTFIKKYNNFNQQHPKQENFIFVIFIFIVIDIETPINS